MAGNRIGRLNCIRLWRIWDFFLILLLYTYIVYDSIFRYVLFKKGSLDPAFGSNYCPMIMNIYLMSIIGGITFIVLSLYCLVSNNDNYGDDGIRLGRDTDNLRLYEENESVDNQTNSIIESKRKKSYLLKRFKRHFLPLSGSLHYLSALCFLMPLPFVEAHQIHQRILTANNLWHTDLDFIFEPDNWHKLFVLDGPVNNWILRPQYFNLILSLVSMSVRYASVFWSCHRGFAFIFSLLMMLSSIHILLDYSATTILIRLAYNPDFISLSLRIDSLSAHNLMCLSYLGSTVILISFCCVFEFGFQQFMETLSRYRHIVTMQSDSSHDGCNLFDLDCYSKKHLYLRGYLPHLSAICAVVIGIGMKIPLLYAGINIVYKLTGDPLILTNLLITIAFICSWLITWFGFSLKPAWRFALSNCSKTMSEISSTVTTGVQQSRQMSSEQINQVYSCFHNPDNRIDNTLQNRIRNRDYFAEETEFYGNAACTNYVYLQSTMNPALNQMMVPYPSHDESSLVASFVETPDQRNIMSDRESSYDSAINIRNQLLTTLDHQIGRSQSQAIRNFGVLKYSGDNLRSQTAEYIPLQTETSCGSTIKFEDCSSPDTSTLHAAESDATLKSNHGSQQPLTYSTSLNRQNSNKKRIFGPRVTFKDEHSSDMVDCSPNNSEQSSNNTTSSDSGIDFNSKQHRNLQNLQTRNNISHTVDNTHTVGTRPSTGTTNSKCIPVPIYSTPSTNNLQFNFDILTSSQAMLNVRSQNCPTSDVPENCNDDNSISYISEDLTEERLCSQV